MPLLLVTGGPQPPAGKVLASGTRLRVRYWSTYVDGTDVHPRLHHAEWDATTGGWKPEGAADSTPFYLPGGIAGDRPPMCTVVERQAYVGGGSQTFARPPSRIIQTSAGEWAYAVDGTPFVGVHLDGSATGAGTTAGDLTADGVALLGVGSSTDSLTTYPKIANTTTGDWYVDASVSVSGAGTSLATAFKTLAEGLAALTVGDTLLVKGGTYALGSGGIWRNTAWASTTRIMGYGTDRPILDATSVGTNNSALTLSGSTNEIWHRFHIKNVPSAGGGFNGQSVRLVSSASNNTLSDLHVSHCITDGIYAYNADNNIILDCAVWRLGDGVDTGTNAPDCYAIKGGSSGNALVRCFGAHGPDDVYDFWDANGNTVRDSVAYKGGYYWSGANGSASSGDRMGFKMSGSSTTTPNHCYGSIAIACRSDGLQSNQQNLAFDYARCTTVLNEGLGADFNGDSSGMTGTANDCISLNNTASGNQGATYSVYAGAYYNHTYNNWNLGISAPAFADTVNYDWSLSAGSPAIGAGIAGGNLGASDVALLIAKEWLAKDLT